MQGREEEREEGKGNTDDWGGRERKLNQMGSKGKGMGRVVN